MQDRRLDLAGHTNGNGERRPRGKRCCRLLGRVEKMGRVLPQNCICNMNIGCKAGPAQRQMFAG